MWLEFVLMEYKMIKHQVEVVHLNDEPPHHSPAASPGLWRPCWHSWNWRRHRNAHEELGCSLFRHTCNHGNTQSLTYSEAVWCRPAAVTVLLTFTNQVSHTHTHTHTECFYILKRSRRSSSVTSTVMFPTHRERQLLQDKEKGETAAEKREKKTSGWCEQEVTEWGKDRDVREIITVIWLILKRAVWLCALLQRPTRSGPAEVCASVLEVRGDRKRTNVFNHCGLLLCWHGINCSIISINLISKLDHHHGASHGLNTL